MILPWALPTVVNAILWRLIYNPEYGALNSALLQLGVIDAYRSWLGEPNSAMLAMVVADVWKNFPLVGLISLAALQSVPRETLAAAADVVGLELSVEGNNLLDTYRYRFTDVSPHFLNLAERRFGTPPWLGFARLDLTATVEEDAERFDIGRAQNPHMTFGHGIHFCLGAPLARLEATIALQVLSRRFRSVRPIDPASLRYGPSCILRGLTALPVELVPR